MNIEYEFSVFTVSHDTWQAGGAAPTKDEAEREAKHYLMHYTQDEPHYYIIEEVTKKEVARGTS